MALLPLAPAAGKVDVRAPFVGLLVEPEEGSPFRGPVRLTTAAFERAHALRANDPHLYRRYLALSRVRRSGSGPHPADTDLVQPHCQGPTRTTGDPLVSDFLLAFPWLHAGRLRGFDAQARRGRAALLALSQDLAAIVRLANDAGHLDEATRAWLATPEIQAWLTAYGRREPAHTEDAWHRLVGAADARVQFDMYRLGAT